MGLIFKGPNLKSMTEFNYFDGSVMPHIQYADDRDENGPTA